MIKYRHDLPQLMKDMGLPLTGAELGVAEGNFSNDLLNGGLEKLYLVDTWATLNVRGDAGFPQEWHDENLKKTLSKMAKHGEKFVILRGLTTEMAREVEDESLGLVYLDASHWYADVMNDLNAWFPKLVKGGICAGHDYANRAYGVAQAVGDFCKDKYSFNIIIENKPEDAGFIFIK